MTEAAIRIQNLKKTYRDRKTKQEKVALHGVDLEIPRGSFFGLLGPNGAGKSTLINILAGTVVKSSGTVAIMGHDIDAAQRQAKLSIGIVPQELVLDTFFTVRQALEITAGYYGIPKEKRRTDGIIRAMGLADKADSPSRRLSGGMRRRLLIGKALVHNPPVLILDEPTAGVDVELRKQLWNYVLELNRRGVTIVLTTHYLEEAQELCDEIAIINRGQVVAHEPTATLLRRMDTRNVVVTPEEPVTAAPLLAGFETKLRPGGAFAVSYRTGQSSVEQVLAAVRASGLHIRDIATEDPDLEDVFVSLTYAAQDEPASAA